MPKVRVDHGPPRPGSGALSLPRLRAHARESPVAGSRCIASGLSASGPHLTGIIWKELVELPRPPDASKAYHGLVRHLFANHAWTSPYAKKTAARFADACHSMERRIVETAPETAQIAPK